MRSNVSDWRQTVRLNGSVNYAAAEEQESISVNLRGDGLYAVSMVGFTSVGDGPMSQPCYFNMSCDTEKEKYSSASLSSGILQCLYGN